ncbi:hypothetical protein EIP91_011175 [Steccherinum ochraceum]|uniref:Fungal-type protein kinase domain-containing protein n=1 Tax=Steccherinum ochraceum TaxID=92696 RepID=A0A4R0RL84_9APHY|nr:hypothetical protein EIP91_011175 [Steccherinum ochraceum]
MAQAPPLPGRSPPRHNLRTFLANPPGFKTSPAKATAHAIAEHSSTTLLAKPRQRLLATELRGHLVGPLDPVVFMKKFTPVQGEVPPEVLENVSFSEMPEFVRHENEMYGPFVETVESSKLFPPGSFTMYDTSVTGEDETKLMPDVSLLLYLATSFKWDFVEFSVEFKRVIAQDGFCDDHAETAIKFLEKLDNDAIELIKGQLAQYAAAQLAHQHHTFVVTIFICGDFARFIRWDRSGALVSKRFNYREDPAVLAEFFWRYGQLSPVERGLDHTVQAATVAEAEKLSKALQTHASNPSKRRIPEDHFYLIQKPFSFPISVLGRSTRAYVALDLSAPDEEHQLVFLKDYWRISSRPSEAEIYSELSQAQVPHLPSVLASGDVLDDSIKSHTTQTQAWRFEEGVCLTETLREYRHHRVVQKLLFRLSSVKNSRELVSAIRDIVQCIGSAAQLAHWLHRNISLESLMITESGEGILNDWDHGIKIIADRDAASARSATWQFLSCSLISNPGKPHDMNDDLESTFWVLVHQSIHYFASTATRHQACMFDERKESSEPILGGVNGKFDYLVANSTTPTITFECEPLNELLIELRCHFLSCLTNSLTAVLNHLNDALGKDNWPAHDVLPDRFPPQSDTSTNKEIRRAHMSSVSSRTLVEGTQPSASTTAVSVEKGFTKRSVTHEDTRPQAGPSKLDSSKKRKADAEEVVEEPATSSSTTNAPKARRPRKKKQKKSSPKPV